MNKSIIGALLVALVCMAAPAMAVIAQPPTPFVISGHVFDADNNPCNGAWVQITNLNTSMNWDAENSSTSNYYELELDSDDVSVDDIIRIEASGCSLPKTVEHTVTQNDIDEGGFIQDITFEPDEKPDLIVESVSINPDCKHYYFANEPNVVDITVKNIGTGAAGASHAKVTGASGASATAAVGALAPGASETVRVSDAVARPAGEVVTAIADCDGEVTESDETNNGLQIVDGDGNNVINHGFKGKWMAEGYAGSDPGNMTTWKSYELHGDLTYSVGDSYYVSGYENWEHYTANWTTGDLPISGDATVVEARLYVYYTWDKAWVMPDNVSTSFNGVNQDPYDVHYMDKRGYGTGPPSGYNLPYGALVYNVTVDFDTSGNHANVTKLIAPTSQVSMRGMMLVVVYEDSTEPLRQIFVIEEFDSLYGSASYCTTPDEATARALFTGPSIDMGTMEHADLITIVNGAGAHDGVYNPIEGDLIFNGQLLSDDAWDFLPGPNTGGGTYGETELGANVTDVTNWLQATGNRVGMQSNGDWMEPSNAFLVVEYEEVVEEPDLIVESVYLNPYCGKHQYFANESNDVNVTIKNIGTALAGASHTKVTGASGASAIVAVGALAPGQNETVTITDTVLRPDGEVVTAIADCDGEVTESNEANNDLVIDEVVMNHGLKSKRYTGGYTGPDPMNMTTWNSYELNGNLIYSVGDSLYVSDYYSAWTNYTANWTAGDLPISGDATVVDARLYVYYTWERVDVMPDLVILEFNGVNQVVDAHYTDRKGDIAHGTTYDLPYGAVVYDVTADFDRNSNHADFYKTIPPAAKQVSMRGMMLVVIYEDSTEPLRQIFVIEEFDNLYGSDSYCTTPEEATAWALFTGPAIDLGTMEHADLITIVNGAGSHDGVYDPAEGELIFNGNVWTDAWDFLPGTGASSATETELGARDLDVTDYLQATDNAVGFQSSGDWMEASNAFLVVEYEEETIASYGESVYAKKNTRFAWRALDEPDDVGAVLLRNAEITIELEETIPACKDVSVRVVRLGFQTVNFDVAVSPDGTSWTTIGSESINSWMTWEDYDFEGDFGDVRYIKITKPGTRWIPRLMGLDAVYAEN